MYAVNANLRPAYTDNEISRLFHEKRLKNKDTIAALAKQFCTSIGIISNIDNYKYDFSMNMIKIASEYLDIPVSDLTKILIDDKDNFSCRGCNNEKSKAVIDIVNILFNEMIMQKKLSI
jgi:hypothetical protein